METAAAPHPSPPGGRQQLQAVSSGSQLSRCWPLGLSCLLRNSPCNLKGLSHNLWAFLVSGVERDVQ